jgi:hypothetical protein
MHGSRPLLLIRFHGVVLKLRTEILLNGMIIKDRTTLLSTIKRGFVRRSHIKDTDNGEKREVVHWMNP